MRVLVCGGREFVADGVMRRTLGSLVGWMTVVIHGGARGADRLAGKIAAELGLPVEEYPADWTKWGDVAGKIRNNEMLASGIDLVVAFPGGAGTAHMVRMARAVGVPVHEVQP